MRRTNWASVVSGIGVTSCSRWLSSTRRSIAATERSIDSRFAGSTGFETTRNRGRLSAARSSSDAYLRSSAAVSGRHVGDRCGERPARPAFSFASFASFVLNSRTTASASATPSLRPSCRRASTSPW
ncbi:MAG: hypothetical protein EBS51_04850 [Planctomycetia bacterium]|nr:hypothetical protein [Planctomycetia bacterium]